MWTRALTGCPARCGSRSEASRRRIASASASWYRCGRVRRSPPPAGADRASRTAWTIAAHSGVRSPWMTPAPSKVVSRDTPRSSRGSLSSSGSRSAVRARISAQIAARPRRSTPARAAATRISSASARYSSGMALVHLASCRASDLVSTQPSASAASSTGGPGPAPGQPGTPRPGPWSPAASGPARPGWCAARRPGARPGRRRPSSSRPRTAASIASWRSRARSRSAAAWAGRPAASWAARNRSAPTPACPARTPACPAPRRRWPGPSWCTLSWLTSPGSGLDAVPDPTVSGGSDISGWPTTAFDYVFAEN